VRSGGALAMSSRTGTVTAQEMTDQSNNKEVIAAKCTAVNVHQFTEYALVHDVWLCFLKQAALLHVATAVAQHATQLHW
jgi:tRNA(Phe) wybutosine-synthesizing methylase Tyw3